MSWQYHHRRAEMWRVVEGPVGIVRSATDEEGEVKLFEAGQTIVLEKGERHRLIGLENWGVVTEFWQHTDPDHPSDEDDIIRILTKNNYIKLEKPDKIDNHLRVKNKKLWKTVVHKM